MCYEAPEKREINSKKNTISRNLEEMLNTQVYKIK